MKVNVPAQDPEIEKVMAQNQGTLIDAFVHVISHRLLRHAIHGVIHGSLYWSTDFSLELLLRLYLKRLNTIEDGRLHT